MSPTPYSQPELEPEVKHVVLAHDHDKTEKVYRLIVQPVAYVPTVVPIPNPDYDDSKPQSAENYPVLRYEEQVIAQERAPMDIVWDAEDPRWEGKSADEIATEQRQELRKRMQANDAQQRQAAVKARKGKTSLGGVGDEL